MNENARSRRDRHQYGPVRSALEHAGFLAIVAPLGWMPLWLNSAIGAAIGALFGATQRWLGTKYHRSAQRNLEIAFPEKPPAERDAILRAMWRNWGRMITEVAKLPRLSQQRVLSIVRMDPESRYREIAERAKEHGALILTAHFGTFELLLNAVGAAGTPVSIIHRTLHNPHVDAWLSRVRERFGSRQLRRGDAAREVLRELHAGRIVAIPFDQTAPRASRVFTPFFGVHAATNTGLARLALASRAPVYPVVLVREGTSSRHRAVYGPEIPLVRSDDRERDVAENTRRFNEVLEAIIRDRPDHWIWMYRRWKAQPDGSISPYLDESPPLETYRAAARAVAVRT